MHYFSCAVFVADAMPVHIRLRIFGKNFMFLAISVPESILTITLTCSRPGSTIGLACGRKHEVLYTNVWSCKILCHSVSMDSIKASKLLMAYKVCKHLQARDVFNTVESNN